jgi:hypothetical protein
MVFKNKNQGKAMSIGEVASFKLKASAVSFVVLGQGKIFVFLLLQ